MDSANVKITSCSMSFLTAGSMMFMKNLTPTVGQNEFSHLRNCWMQVCFKCILNIICWPSVGQKNFSFQLALCPTLTPIMISIFQKMKILPKFYNSTIFLQKIKFWEAMQQIYKSWLNLAWVVLHLILLGIIFKNNSAIFKAIFCT